MRKILNARTKRQGPERSGKTHSSTAATTRIPLIVAFIVSSLMLVGLPVVTSGSFLLPRIVLRHARQQQQQSHHHYHRFRSGSQQEGTVSSSWLVSKRRLMSSSNDDDTKTSKKNEQPRLLLSVRDRLVSTGSSTTNDDGSGKVRLILASVSPRRKEILEMMGLENKFDTIPSPLNETQLQLELSPPNPSSVVTSSSEQQQKSGGVRAASNPMEYTRILAQEKAKALAMAFAEVEQKESPHPMRLDGPTLILGSDTIVDLDGTILEKPKDEQDARRMIRTLSNRNHCVHTAVAIYSVVRQVSSDSSSVVVSLQASFVDTARVQFADLTADDIDAYVATGEPMDKAGSYGIQGIGGQLVASVQGDFFTVMGLPMHRVSLALNQALQEIVVVEQQQKGS